MFLLLHFVEFDLLLFLYREHVLIFLHHSFLFLLFVALWSTDPGFFLLKLIIKLIFKLLFRRKIMSWLFIDDFWRALIILWKILFNLFDFALLIDLLYDLLWLLGFVVFALVHFSSLIFCQLSIIMLFINSPFYKTLDLISTDLFYSQSIFT